MMMLLVKSPRTAKLNTMNTDSQAEHSVQWQPSWAHWMRTAMLDTVYDDSEAQHNERCQPSSTQWTMRAKIDSKQNDIQARLTVKLETRYVDSQAWHKSQERQTCHKFQWQPSLAQVTVTAKRDTVNWGLQRLTQRKKLATSSNDSQAWHSEKMTAKRDASSNGNIKHSLHTFPVFSLQ